MATNQPQARKNALPMQDATPQRVYHDYDIPEELWPDARTADFGEIRTISLKLLTPLEEKAAVGRARGDGLRMAYELAETSIAEVTDKDGVARQVAAHDGTLQLLVAQMHPIIRSLVMQGYSDTAAPSEKASVGFLKSRRLRT